MKKKRPSVRRAGSWNWINVTALSSVLLSVQYVCVRVYVCTVFEEKKRTAHRSVRKEAAQSRYRHTKLPTDLTTDRYSTRKKKETYIVFNGYVCVGDDIAPLSFKHSPSTMNFQTHRLNCFAGNQWLAFRQNKKWRKKNLSVPHDMAWPDEKKTRRKKNRPCHLTVNLTSPSSHHLSVSQNL